MNGGKELKSFCVSRSSECLTETQSNQVFEWCVEAQKLYNVIDPSNESAAEFNEYNYIGLDDTLDAYSSNRTDDYSYNIIPFSEVRSHLGLPPLEDNVTEQLQAVEDDIVPTVKDAHKEPFDPRNLLSDTVLDIAYSKEGITVTPAVMDDQFMVNTNEELLMLCELLSKIDSFKVV